MTEREFAEKISELGGRAYIVGGWVRDRIMGREAKDKDYVICGVTNEQFKSAISGAKLVGQSFPVFLVDIDGKKCEVAFGRKERKAGRGYRGFEVEFDASITIEEDLQRRDTTMNAIAYDILTGQQVDLFGGEQDIKNGVIRAISENFKDDPVRALRCARQSAQLGFSVEENTISLMRECREELAAEPPERIVNELKRALEADKPSVFFQVLRQADLVKDIFPELHALIGKTQPVEYHPEGDSWNHTMEVVDIVAKATPNIVARFCGLVHDLGKGRTPMDMLPHHYGHEAKGGYVLKDWNKRMTLPRQWMKAGEFVIREHMRAPRITKKGKIVDLLLSTRQLLPDLPYDDFKEIIRADHKSLPEYLEYGNEIITLMEQVSGNDAPENITGKHIGDWIRSQQVKLYCGWKHKA